MPATPMATLVVVLTAAAAAAPPRADSLTLDYKFEEYVQAFGKKYGKDEFEQRRIIYQQRLRDVVAHNAAQGQHKYKKGINHLSDWTDAELDGILGWVPADRPVAHTPIAVSTAPQSSAVLPSAVDWRACTPWADSPLCPLAKRPASPVTTSVKNQGHCGSCWAFASTATLESHFSLATGRSEALAPQHLVSCAPNPNDCGGTGGCQGSTADVAYDWLSKNGGLASAYTYGYASGVNGTTGECDSQRATPLARVGGFAKPASNDYEALMRAVATAGPVAVNVYASTWNDYESGVFDGCNYSKSLPINHVVVLEGYGTDDASGLDYWLVRNSWSTAYGEHGYIRLLREKRPVCGTDAQPGSGWDCAPYPRSEKVCGMCGIAYEPTYPTGVGVAGTPP